MSTTASDRRALIELGRLARESSLDVAGGTVRRSSPRFCLGVEPGDHTGTELFGVGTDRFIWLAFAEDFTVHVCSLVDGITTLDGTLGSEPR